MIDKRRLELFRLSPIGRVFIKSIEAGGGELRAGSYQFAVRFANSQTGESTKFSLFTNPVSIGDLSSSGVLSGGIGSRTDKSFVLGIQASSQEVIQYDVYQIAVIENNAGNPAFSTNVSLSQFYTLDSQDFIFNYDSNERFDSVDLADVSIDDAAINTFKTLTIKNNRLVGGNIKYKNLSYDRGTPEVTFGSIKDIQIPIRQGFDTASSTTKGYFRGEVYRFAVTYWDEYGDFSTPVALDMSNVSGNQATNTGFKDMKFPDRSNGEADVIRTIGGITYSIAMGLSLSIRNHPSWARGMVVLRAERKKDILFQSPLVPTTVIQSPDAVNNFPGDDRKLPSIFGTIAPKNFLKSNNQGIVRDNNGQDVVYKENYAGFEYCKQIHLAFPPEIIYNNGTLPYAQDIPNGNIQIEAIDYVSLRPISFSNMNDEVTNATLGNKIDSSVHVTFAARNQDDYASGSKSKATIRTEIGASLRTVKDEAVTIDLIAEGQDRAVITSINSAAKTSFFGAYDDLTIDPDGAYNGYKPSNQKAAIVVTKGNRPDPSHFALSGALTGFPAATLQTTAGRINTTDIASDATKNRNLLNLNGANEGSGSRHYLEIVNFKRGLSDTRYGDPKSVQTFIPTGSVFNNAGQPMNVTDIEIDVFGGDCVVSPFTFKVHDSAYGIVSAPGTASYNVDDWGGTDFEVSTGVQVKRPVPYRSASACIGMYLESEVNGYLEDKLIYKNTNNNAIIDRGVTNWVSSPVAVNQVVKYLDRHYLTLRPVTSAEFPGASIGVTGSDISNIGYAYLDLGEVYEGKIFPALSDTDLFLTTSSYRESRVGFQYLYNPNYSFGNRSKFFVTTGAGQENNRTSFSSRMVYSDVKILQTNIEGFSRMRALNFYDLEESKGAITKLLNHKGKMLSIQDLAFAYVPFEANVIEAQDGIQLAIRSADIVGIPQYIEDYGSKYIRSVISTPFGVYFADTNNSSIIKFSEGISRMNDLRIDNIIREYSSSLIDIDVNDNDISFYDDQRNGDIVFNYQGKGIFVNQRENLVHSVIRFGNDPLVQWRNGFFANSKHYVFGWEINTLLSPIRRRFVMSDFDVTGFNSPFGNNGATFGGHVKSIVNADFMYPKVLDILKINSTAANYAKVESFAQGVSREQFGFGVHLKLMKADRGEAWFLLNAIRQDPPLDPPARWNPKRLRGEHFEVTYTVGHELLYSFISKYRISDRRL